MTLDKAPAIRDGCHIVARLNPVELLGTSDLGIDVRRVALLGSVGLVRAHLLRPDDGVRAGAVGVPR